MLRYEMRHDILFNQDIGNYEAYGIDVFEGEKLMRSVPDISTEQTELANLVRLLNELEPELIHLDDIVEDFLP